MLDKNLDAFKEVQEEVVIDTSKKVRVGIIGTGWNADKESSCRTFAPRFMYGKVSCVMETSALQFKSIIFMQSCNGIWS